MTRASGAWSLTAALLVLVSGCAGRGPGPVDFSEARRAYGAGDYETVRERWTRHGKLVVLDVGTVLEAWATFKSWDFRQAYIEQYAHAYGLQPNERAELHQAQLEAGREVYEFHLVAESTDYKWNDLESKDSPWKVRLVDGAGAEIAPTSIQVEKYPELYEMRFYPTRTDFSRTYLVKFAVAGADTQGRGFAGPASGRMTLRVAGPLGRTDLVWIAQ